MRTSRIQIIRNKQVKRQNKIEKIYSKKQKSRGTLEMFIYG